MLCDRYQKGSSCLGVYVNLIAVSLLALAIPRRYVMDSSPLRVKKHYMIHKVRGYGVENDLSFFYVRESSLLGSSRPKVDPVDHGV